MARTVEGIYRNGKVELLEPAPCEQEARVVVTFPAANGTVDLASRQITPEQAERLRARLKAFEEDWLRPEMDAYDAIWLWGCRSGSVSGFQFAHREAASSLGDSWPTI